MKLSGNNKSPLFDGAILLGGPAQQSPILVVSLDARFDQFVKLVNSAEISQCHDCLRQIRRHLNSVRFRIQGQTAVAIVGHFKIARVEQLFQFVAIRRLGFFSHEPQ